MKKLLVLAMLFVPSIALAWNDDFDFVAAELRAEVPRRYSSAVIGNGTMLILASPACSHSSFISGLRAKYKAPSVRRHVINLGYNTLSCSDGRLSKSVF